MFQKRIYKNPGVFFKNLGAIVYRFGAMPGILKGTALSPTFRERLMLVVTSVNACRYCTYVHTRAASASGLSNEEIHNLTNHMLDDSPDNEVPALYYALQWAESNGQVDETIRQQMVETYGEKLLKSIELSLEMIKMGNLCGNTLDYSLYRISSGKWGADSGNQRTGKKMTNKTAIHYIYFSPTGTTRTTLEAIGKGMDGITGSITDVTKSTPKEIPQFSKNDVVLIGIPVYSGRLPTLATERLKSVKGNGATVVPVVVYGNRHYDDALIELYNLCLERDFHPVAAAAFVGEHSFSTPELPLSLGRPDGADLEKAEQFGRQIGNTALPPNQIPGNRPYKAISNPTGSATSVDATICTQCGKCIKSCPTQGMTMTETAAEADPNNCIWCLACLRFCPANARTITNEKTKNSAQKLNDLFSERREPETFIP